VFNLNSPTAGAAGRSELVPAAICIAQTVFPFANCVKGEYRFKKFAI